MEPPLWSEGASAFAHEREALAFVRSRLPDHEPYRAWSNVEFIAEDGSINEVDLLVVSPRGFLLIEIKSYPGKLFGDSQRWRLVRPDGSEAIVDHPVILANTKAKRLRSLLARQKAFKGEQVPYVTAMVFLSSPELDCRLHDVGRTAVAGRDPDPATHPGAARVQEDTAEQRSAFAPLPGVAAAIKDPTLLNLKAGAVNKPMSKRIADAIDQAGLRPLNRGRMAGDWELGDLLDEGPGWQDFAGSRASLGATRRVRIYLAGAATTEDDEQRLRREAQREFKLLEQLTHTSIADAKDIVDADRGPALLFDRHPDEERLDLWAPEHLDELQIDQRIDLVRQLGEALVHAHANRITHRSLTARSVLVRPAAEPGGTPRLVIGHWQAGARELATRLTRHTTTSTGTATSTATGSDPDLGADLAERLAANDQVYLAPETFTVDDPDPVGLDVFSLGSLAFLLLSGQPAATDPVARDAMLQDRGGLSLPSVIDGLPESLDLFVQCATDPVPAGRPPLKELLSQLDEALDELTTPAPDDTPDGTPDDGPTVDPAHAHQGARLEGGWEVERRLGSGSTAVALLCTRVGSPEPEVLKIAKDESWADRLLDEARALERLRHEGIVRLHGIERVGGRTTLRLSPAGDPDDKSGLTLADRLNAHGRVGLDLLERFGTDLLDVVEYLEQMGVAHRDIKPDNLGVRPRPGDRSLHLVLFDFSLTKTPDTSLGAGTPGYLDPFLAERPGKRWDPAADRYAAAATLHEMATGVRPVWGDGRTDPIHVPDDNPTLDPDLFDPAVRAPMVAFFERALHRRPGERFDTVDQMRQAWRAVFADAARRVTSSDHDAVDDDTLHELAAAATPETPVTELGLSGIAVSVLERRGITTVEQFLALAPMEWNRTPGLGLRTRREILDAVGRLRTHVDVEPEVDDQRATIDRLVGLLIPRPVTAQAKADAEPLGRLLGLPVQERLGSPTGVEPSTPWPSFAEVRAAGDLSRAEYDALLDRARVRWAKQPAITQVRHDIASLLERSGGVLPGAEIADALIAQRGSTAVGPERRAKARAVVRAALETEAVRVGNRFTWRRLGGGSAMVVARRSEELEAEELADYASNLGVVADQLAASDPLPTPELVEERLRAVPVPTGLIPLPVFRLARLAAAASATAAVSSRLEIYRRDLEPERSVRLARSALLGTGTLSEDEVRARVKARFPRSQTLPPRPQLDRLLDAAVGLVWAEAGPGPTGVMHPAGYRLARVGGQAPSTAMGLSGSRYSTGAAAGVSDEEREHAAEVDERLTRHAATGGYLVLTVSAAQHQRAVEQLTRFDPHVVDVDRWLVDALREHAAVKGIRWDAAILAADAAGPSGERWPKLLTVVRDALAGPRDALLRGHEHLLLTNPGLLGRYELLGLLDELREATRRPVDGQRLRTLWVLVPADDVTSLPSIAGRAVPVTTAAEHLVLPGSWLKNLHQTVPSSTQPSPSGSSLSGGNP